MTLQVRRVLLGPGKKGVGLAPGAKGGLTEWAQDGSLSDFNFNVFFDVRGVLCGGGMIIPQRGLYWALIVGWEPVL